MPLPRQAVPLAVGVFLIVSLLVGCGGGDSVIVKEENYGEQWPLTVSEAELFCKGYGAIYVKIGGDYYGVNGFGINYVKENFPNSSRNIKDIWRSDPRGINPNVSLNPLFEAGGELCES